MHCYRLITCQYPTFLQQWCNKDDEEYRQFHGDENDEQDWAGQDGVGQVQQDGVEQDWAEQDDNGQDDNGQDGIGQIEAVWNNDNYMWGDDIIWGGAQDWNDWDDDDGDWDMYTDYNSGIDLDEGENDDWPYAVDWYAEEGGEDWDMELIEAEVQVQTLMNISFLMITLLNQYQ